MAIILSHEDGGTYVLDRDGSYRFIKGYTERPVGSEITLPRQKSTLLLRVFAAASAAAAVIFVWLWFSVSTTIYVDFNPSFELSFNRFGRLITVRSFDELSENFATGLVLRGSPGDVVETLISEIIEREMFMGERPVLLLAVVSNNARRGEILQTSITDRINPSELALLVLDGLEYLELARELGVTPGRMQLVSRILNCTEEFDDILQRSVRELLNKIQEECYA